MAAKNYTEILALVNAGNQMGLSNTIKRDYGIPLDFTSVQPSYADAVIYAAENTKAYIGQPLSVGGKLYIINDVAAEAKYAVGEKEYDNYLVEVGSATEGDGVTIDLEEGVLTLHGFESALTGYLPRKAEDGTLEWVPISAVVQGDGNKVTTLTSEDGSVTITKKTDTDESLVYDLSVEAYDDTDVKDRLDVVEKAIGEEASEDKDASGIYAKIADAEQNAKDYADGLAVNYDAAGAAEQALEDAKDYADGLADNYDTAGSAEQALQDAKDYADSLASNYDASGSAATAEQNAKAYADSLANNYDVSGAAADAESNAKDYTDTEIAGLKVSIEQREGVEYIVVRSKDEEEITSVNASKFVQDSFLDDVAYDSETGKIKFTWSMGDGSTKTDEVAVADFVQTYTNGTGLKLEGNQFLVDTDVIATVEELNKVKATAEAAQTAQEVSDAIDAKIMAENLAQYAVKADVEDALDNKVDKDTYTTDKATFALASEVETALAGKVNNDVLNDYYTSAQVDAKGYAVATDVADTYATKQSLADQANTIAATLSDYAKTADVEAELAKKIESGNIAHTSEGVAEGVSVEGTELKIVVDAYSKAETLQKIEDKIKSFTGGESAADVKSALEDYEELNDARVSIIESKNDAQDTAIGNAQADATKALADAKTANDNLASLISGTIATHTADINAVKGRLDTLEDAKGNHETRIATAEGKITSLETVTGSNSTAIGLLQGKDTELANEDLRLAGLIEGLESSKANAADVYSKTAADEAIAKAIAAIPAVDLSAYAKSEDVANTYATITAVEAIYKAGEGEAAATGVLADEIARAKAAEEKIAGDLALLIENPTTALDSVKELIEHVQAHGTAVEGIVTRLNGHDSILTGIGGEDQPATVIAAINNAVAAVVHPKASEEISVAADGTLGINEVNINKLVQTTGDELILNGGSAA